MDRDRRRLFQIHICWGCWARARGAAKSQPIVMAVSSRGQGKSLISEGSWRDSNAIPNILHPRRSLFCCILMYLSCGVSVLQCQGLRKAFGGRAPGSGPDVCCSACIPTSSSHSAYHSQAQQLAQSYHVRASTTSSSFNKTSCQSTDSNRRSSPRCCELCDRERLIAAQQGKAQGPSAGRSRTVD